MQFFKHIKLVATLLFASLTHSALHAGISPLAFKDVSKCFKPGYEYYSPIFGSIALTSGVIEDLRFYNVTAAFDKAGKREYIEDKARKDDHIMEIVNILFPSPAGQLTTETNAKNNFGRLCKPEHVAALLNFAHAVRQYLKKNPTNELPITIELLLKIPGGADIKTAFPAKTFSTSTPKNKLLMSIARAIEQEVRPPKTTFRPAFYPRYIVEQILNAFFCHMFADQIAIKALLHALNKDIVDHTQIDKIDRLLELTDVEPALKNVRNGTCTLDDIWIICNRNVFSRILPYENGKTPISNGSAQMYQRATDTLSTTITFADCVEVTLRHIINFMLYDGLTHRFDMTTLKAYMIDKNNDYIDNLYEFYGIQSPDKANAGNETIRSAWNKVVADLRNGVVYRETFDAADSNNNNELDTGMLNMIRVFKTIFSLELEPEPIYEAGQEDAFKNSAQEYVTDSLTKLFKILNATYTCDISYSNITIEAALKDIIGNICIEIQDSNTKKLFSFIIRVQDSHVDIKNLSITQKDSVKILQDDIQTIQEIALAQEYRNTIFPSLLLLDSRLQPHETLPGMSILYQLFKETINDSTSMVNALKSIQHLLDKNLIDQNLAAPILKNILHDFLWDDRAIMLSAMEAIIKVKDLSSTVLMTVLKDEVKGLALTGKADEDLLAFFPNIENLYGTHDCVITNMSLISYPRLKKLDLRSTTRLQSITFPDAMESLEEINLSYPVITSLKLPSCPKLRTLNLSSTEKLQTISFSGTMTNLEEISLSYSGLTHLTLPSCPKLKKLNLRDTKQLQSITIPDTMESLEEIILSNSWITNLTLPSFSKLKVLDLGNTIRLQSITFSGTMESLEVIILSNSWITNVTLPSCPKLKNLDMRYTRKLKSITLPGSMENLEELDLSNSALTTLRLPPCPKLQQLNIEGSAIKNITAI